MDVADHLRRFARKSLEEKREAVRFRFKGLWNQFLPGVPLPCRLDGGMWWLAEDDELGDGVFCRTWELAERRFVQRFLGPAMTVVDAGAHHGLYTLLASRKVAGDGRVVAFEPSPREVVRLRRHLRLNRCRNVVVAEAALGAQVGEGLLFVAEGRHTGHNSLRAPAVEARCTHVTVPVTTLDSFLAQRRIPFVDFLKLDLEGGELDALRGAPQLLERPPRPVVLSEVQGVRTAPWGYAASEIQTSLCRLGYRWFRPRDDGSLHAIAEGFVMDGNFIGVPEERLSALTAFIHSAGRPSQPGEAAAEAAGERNASQERLGNWQ